MRVRIQDGLVMEVCPEGSVYHPDIEAQIVEAPEGVVGGWRVDGESFLPPEDPPAVEPSLVERIALLEASVGVLASQANINDLSEQAAALVAEKAALVEEAISAKTSAQLVR